MTYNPKTASVTELRQNATKLLHDLKDSREPVFILQNSKKAGVLLDERTFEELLTYRFFQVSSGRGNHNEKADRYFGKGKDIFGDGLAYQKKARDEWK